MNTGRTLRNPHTEENEMTDSRADKIAALLAKAEATDNEHERDAFSKAAEKLMLKWGIDEAMAQAAAAGKTGAPVAKMTRRTIEWTSTYYTAWQQLAAQIQLGMGGVMVIKHGNLKMTILGTEGDVARYVQLFDSVKIQAERAVREWWKSYQRTWFDNGASDWVLRRQFLLSFGVVVGTRLLDERTRLQDETTGSALVLVNKDKAVAQYVTAQFPRLGTARRTSLQGGSSEARRAGRAAGQRASLNTRQAVRA